MSRRTSRFDFSRRSFLRFGTASVAGLQLGSVLAAESLRGMSDQVGTANNVILIWLDGGPATIDMWDMKPDAPESIRGDFGAIDTKIEGMQVCEHMPKLAAVADRCSLIRSLTHTIAAHGPGREYLLRGNRPGPSVSYPSVGSLVTKLMPEPSGVPSYMTLGRIAGTDAGYLGAAHNPFIAGGFDRRRNEPPKPATTVSLPDGFTLDDLERRSKVLDEFDRGFAQLDDLAVPQTLGRFQERALDILRSDKTRVALDYSQEQELLEKRYGTRPLGIGALAARRLVEAGVRFVTLNLPGWDTHSGNFPQLENQLLPTLDQALAGLIEDLDERGMLDETMVVCGGEFGRTPAVNSSSGRDHWSRSMTYLVAGGGFPRGAIYGATDAKGYEPIEKPCSPDDLWATIVGKLGLDPHSHVQTQIGRPMMLFRDGEAFDFS